MTIHLLTGYLSVYHHLILVIQYFLHVCTAPAGPPVGVKVTLIEDDTALVSWKPPDGPETVVTRYTILYASRKAWIAGEWQVLHREGKYHKFSKKMESKVTDDKETNGKKDLVYFKFIFIK